MLNKQQLNGLFQYAMALTQQRDDALDLLQGAVEKYLIELRRGQTIASPEVFTRKILRNKFIDLKRYDQRWLKEDYQEAAVYDISPLAMEDDLVQAEQLSTIWQQLSVVDRDILYHWALLGYSTDELAQELDIPRGTLLSRIHRLRKRLQAQQQEVNA